MARVAFVSHRPADVKVHPKFGEFSESRTSKALRLRNLSGGKQLLPKHILAGLLGHAGGKLKFLDLDFTSFRDTAAQRPRQNPALFLDGLEGGANRIRTNPGVILQAVAAKQLTAFRPRGCDDSTQGREIWFAKM